MGTSLLRTVAAAAVLAFALPSAAQAPSAAGPIAHLPSLAGDYFRLQSQAANRLYHVFVRYPEGYAAEPERRWPVVYLLDGDTLFPMLAPQHLLLHYDENLPDAIVVGIAYGSFEPAVNARDYDFSAPAPDAGERQGGAPAFLRFLKTELIPQVEGRVRADPTRRVLVGQSRSGYMVLWSAVADPDLFWGRIASNPSLTPGRETLFTVPEARPQRSDLGVALVTGSRERSLERRQGALAWGERWEGAADAPWQAELIDLSGGTHAASIGEGYRAAMLWLFNREER
ncbi:MAG TPA: alpha/beta hydrolase-fold protein [Croceibacterium sp.]